MKTIEIVNNWIENDRTGDFQRKITLREAEELIGNIDSEVLESMSECITPEIFMDIWNDHFPA